MLDGHVSFQEMESIIHKAKRLEWLASRAGVMALCLEMGVTFTGIKKDENGKPYLKKSTTELALTHSFPYIAVIMDASHDVGIDLEQPKEKLVRLAHKFVSEKELAFCKLTPIMLCIFWSAKETLYKIYSRRGLIFNEHLSLSEFELQPAGTIRGHIHRDDYKKTFNLHYEVNDDYVLVYNLD